MWGEYVFNCGDLLETMKGKAIRDRDSSVLLRADPYCNFALVFLKQLKTLQESIV